MIYRLPYRRIFRPRRMRLGRRTHSPYSRRRFFYPVRKRRRRDSNSRYLKKIHRFSRPTPSTAQALLRFSTGRTGTLNPACSPRCQPPAKRAGRPGALPPLLDWNVEGRKWQIERIISKYLPLIHSTSKLKKRKECLLFILWARAFLLIPLNYG